MNYYELTHSYKHDKRGVVLNTKVPYQIDFKHLSYKKSSPVIIEDCNEIVGIHKLPPIFEKRQIHPAATSIWSQAAYNVLKPLIKNSIEYEVQLFFEGLTFYFVLPFQYVIQEGAIPDAKLIRKVLPSEVNFFSIESSGGIFVTEAFKSCVETHKFKGFNFSLVKEVSPY